MPLPRAHAAPSGSPGAGRFLLLDGLVRGWGALRAACANGADLEARETLLAGFTTIRTAGASDFAATEIARRIIVELGGEASAQGLVVMQEGDLEQVAALEAAAYPYPWTWGIFRDCLRAGYGCWVLAWVGFQPPNEKVLYVGVGLAVVMAMGGMGKARPRGTAAVKTPVHPDPRDKKRKNESKLSSNNKFSRCSMYY